jgi:hypothetical protein
MHRYKFSSHTRLCWFRQSWKSRSATVSLEGNRFFFTLLFSFYYRLLTAVVLPSSYFSYPFVGCWFLIIHSNSYLVCVLWLHFNGSLSLVSPSLQLLLPSRRTDRTVKLERAFYLFVLQQVVVGCFCYCVGS